ncbi:MAG: hypothetical protein KDD94_14265 [Calditrichaeota bacterium]|nr:hypothetical protein [Calditrichota bacterium]
MKNFLLLVAGCLLVSCGGKYNLISKAYESKQLKASSLTVFLYDSALVISNTDDVEDDLGKGDPNEQYLKVFEKGFSESLLKPSRRIKKVIFSAVDLQLKSPPFPLEKERLLFDQIADYFQLPLGKQTDVSSDYILLIDKLSVYRYGGSAGTFNAATNTFSGGSSEALVNFVRYAVWDNQAGQLVFNGQCAVKSSFMFAMGESNWHAVVRDLAQAIFNNSPFDH